MPTCWVSGLAYLFREWEYSACSLKASPPLLHCVNVFVESLWAACGLRGLQAASCVCSDLAGAIHLFMRALTALESRAAHSGAGLNPESRVANLSSLSCLSAPAQACSCTW
jgi:hypothetical protein